MRKFIMLLFVLALGVNMTAFATNDNNGGGKEGKIELSVKPDLASTQPIPDFNLNRDLVKVVQRPSCGSDPSTTSANPANGWEYQGMNCVGSTCSMLYSRTCEETVTIYWPWGAETYTWETTESKPVYLNPE